ncbi:13890_t:CDS:1, partial [Gigaspora rosea]
KLVQYQSPENCYETTKFHIDTTLFAISNLAVLVISNNSKNLTLENEKHTDASKLKKRETRWKG